MTAFKTTRVKKRLPAKAPETWPGKLHALETLKKFFQRVWGPYLAIGLTRGYIKAVDPKLYNAIINEENWPPTLRLKAQSSRVQTIFKKASKEGVDSLSEKEIARIAVALLRRVEQICGPQQVRFKTKMKLDRA